MKQGIVKPSAITKYCNFDANFYLDDGSKLDKEVAKAEEEVCKARAKLEQVIQLRDAVKARYARMLADGDIEVLTEEAEPGGADDSDQA